MSNYTKDQIEVWKAKAEKWDALAKDIEKFYINEDGEVDEENPVNPGDLTDIGEVAATAFGWL